MSALFVHVSKALSAYTNVQVRLIQSLTRRKEGRRIKVTDAHVLTVKEYLYWIPGAIVISLYQIHLVFHIEPKNRSELVLNDWARLFVDA